MRKKTWFERSNLIAGEADILKVTRVSLVKHPNGIHRVQLQ